MCEFCFGNFDHTKCDVPSYVGKIKQHICTPRPSAGSDAWKQRDRIAACAKLKVNDYIVLRNAYHVRGVSIARVAKKNTTKMGMVDGFEQKKAKVTQPACPTTAQTKAHSEQPHYKQVHGGMVVCVCML